MRHFLERGFRQIEAIRTDPVLIERREAEQNKFKREKKCEHKAQRCFMKPDINKNADSYLDVLDWQQQVLYEPPLLADLDLHQLRQFIDAPLELNLISNRFFSALKI